MPAPQPTTGGTGTGQEIPIRSNTGPFGIPPGGPWFVFPITGTIQRQSNPVAAVGLANAGWVGFPTQAMAKAYVNSNPATHVKNAGKDAASGALSGINAVGDLAHRLTEASTWIRVGEIVAGGLLLYIGIQALFRGTAAGNAVNSAVSTAKKGAFIAAA